MGYLLGSGCPLVFCAIRTTSDSPRHYRTLPGPSRRSEKWHFMHRPHCQHWQLFNSPILGNYARHKNRQPRLKPPSGPLLRRRKRPTYCLFSKLLSLLLVAPLARLGQSCRQDNDTSKHALAWGPSFKGKGDGLQSRLIRLCK